MRSWRKMICEAAMTTKPNNQCPANAEQKSFGQVLFHCAASLFWAVAAVLSESTGRFL